MSLAEDKNLLPNLTRLTLKTPSPSSEQMIMWIQLFLSPTLIEISVVPLAPDQPALLSCTEASTLLRHISSICPTLKFLSIFPDKEDTTSYKEQPCDSRSLFDFWNRSLPRQLKQMKFLCELCTTTEVLTPDTIVYLARLPHLRNLAIYPASRPVILGKITEKNAFPALREFSFNWISHKLAAEIWHLPIFDRITSLKLTLVTQPDDEEIDQWVGLLMSVICGSSPCLTNLSINFDCQDKYDYCVDFSSKPLVKPMKELSLQTLELISVSIEPRADAWNLLPSIWSQLTILRLPHNLVESEELILFSELPALQHLLVKLSLSASPLEDKSSPLNNRNMHFATLKSSSEVKITGDVYEIAWYVLMKLFVDILLTHDCI